MGTYCIGEHLIYERFIPISNYVYALYTCIDNIGLPRISMGGGERGTDDNRRKTKIYMHVLKEQ